MILQTPAIMKNNAPKIGAKPTNKEDFGCSIYTYIQLLHKTRQLFLKKKGRSSTEHGPSGNILFQLESLL